MLLVLLSTIFLGVVPGQATDTTTPRIVGKYYRPYFFNNHPNLCGRMPQLRVYSENEKIKNSWDYYSNINLMAHMIYLAEAQNETCQSNAGVAGQLAKRWKRQGVDMGIFVFNRNHPKSKEKFGMMKRAMGRRWGVANYVSLHQDNNESNLWGDLADETRPFRSKKNDMYLVDRWGRVVRFLRDGILSRTKVNSGYGNIHWRDVVHEVMIAAGKGRTVCDELQQERLYCRWSDEWVLNGRRFSDIRAGSPLTILAFIRADMEEFTDTVNGLIRDMIELSKWWSEPNYVVIVDSSVTSAASFRNVDLQIRIQYADITLLLDEDNTVASHYFAAPGDLFAMDDIGRILGIFNQVNLEMVVTQLNDLHLHGNPQCADIFTDSPTVTPPTTASSGT